MTVGGSRTNGFLFADLRDYTRFVEARGDRAAATLLDEYRVLVRAAVAEFGGAEIKTEGDSFYVVFPSASTAVQCGLAILRAAAESRAQDGGPIRVGVGVHAGETVETEEGLVGSAVNTAARVCSQARPGELLATDTVRGLTRTLLPVRFVDRGARRLKGMAEPVRLYRVDAVDPDHPALAPRGGGFLSRVSPSGIPRTARVAMLLGGLLIGGAASGYLLIAATRPAASDVESAAPTAQATFPDAEEADLLAQVPAELRDRCVRTENAEERIGTVASVRCDLLAAQADTVWFDQFATRQELSNALFGIIEARSLTRAECGPEVPRGQGNWQVGSTHSGQLLCYAEDGSSWIVWSYDAERIVARAVRGGDTLEAWLGLYEWWDQVRLFLE